MLGERIRTIRKQKKMTLEALAGNELTKGMLSLIENNKAKPSMESLTYIAGRLGVEVTDLLEEVSTQELREVLEKAEKLYNVDLEKKTDEHRQLIKHLEPYISNLAHGYESARILDIYSRCLYHEKIPGWKDFSDRAAQIYDNMNMTSKRADIGILRAIVKFYEHDYQQALDIFTKERAEIEARHAYIDPLTRLDLDYNEAILYFAVGDSASATRAMEDAILFSKEHRIFYRIDDLYRLATAHAMLTRNKKNMEYYSSKLKQFGDFADDAQSILFYDLFSIMNLITEKHDYSKAIKEIDNYLSTKKLPDVYEYWHFLEMGKALYGLNQFKEALTYLDKVEVPSYAHHPFDLALIHIGDSYKALCYFELGEHDKAYQYAESAAEKYRSFPDTSFKDFALETFEKVKKQTKG